MTKGIIFDLDSCLSPADEPGQQLRPWQPVKPVYAGGMKANRLRWLLLLLLLIVASQFPAQQSEADSKLLADIRAEAAS